MLWSILRFPSFTRLLSFLEGLDGNALRYYQNSLKVEALQGLRKKRNWEISTVCDKQLNLNSQGQKTQSKASDWKWKHCKNKNPDAMLQKALSKHYLVPHFILVYPAAGKWWNQYVLSSQLFSLQKDSFTWPTTVGLFNTLEFKGNDFKPHTQQHFCLNVNSFQTIMLYLMWHSGIHAT